MRIVWQIERRNTKCDLGSESVVLEGFVDKIMEGSFFVRIYACKSTNPTTRLVTSRGLCTLY